MDKESVTSTSQPGHVREASLNQRETVLAQRESKLDVREAALGKQERRSGELREANEHLVMATLSAQHLEEAAQNTKRQQDEFLAMLTHELRNPLAPIRSAGTLLERLEGLDPRLKTISDVLGRQVEHMARLLDDLLDTSRVISGKVTLQREPTAVSHFVGQAVELCRDLIDVQHQQLTVDLPVIPVYVNGDPTRLAQIVGNLVHNAAKYTPEGGAITVSAKAEGDSVVLQVSDNGSGISEDALSHIFDLFTQEERSLHRSQGGLGIGLTVVRTMVEQHGGTVTVRSAGLGAGSEFTVILPRLDHVVENVSEEARLPTAFKPARILVVDDNVDASTVLGMLLEMAGYEVEMAADGPSALSGFMRQHSQIVLCDIGLPGMSGYEVAQRICQDSESQHAPAPLLVALTGYDGEADRAKALGSGFDHHMAKPVDFKKLLEFIVTAHSPAS